MTILHTPSIPSQGMYHVSFTRKDRFPSVTPDQTNYFNCTYPNNSINSIFLPASEPYNKQTSSYPRASVLRFQALAHCDYAQPLQQQYNLGNKTMHEMILHAVWMKFMAPFLTCTGSKVQTHC